MKVNWFDRGRDAMSEGCPRFIKDARISSKDRAAWYAGWNHQAQLNSAKKIPAADRAEAVAGLQQILNNLKHQP